jgi:hypothetical protein
MKVRLEKGLWWDREVVEEAAGDTTTLSVMFDEPGVGTADADGPGDKQRLGRVHRSRRGKHNGRECCVALATNASRYVRNRSAGVPLLALTLAAVSFASNRPWCVSVCECVCPRARARFRAGA